MVPAEDRSRDFRILGVLGKLYVLMENETGLVLVDQHAAHERILFEDMRRRMESQGVPSQRLLIPLTLQVSPRDADWLANNLPVLHRAGIALDPFGPGTFKIDSLPTYLREPELARLIQDLLACDLPYTCPHGRPTMIQMSYGELEKKFGRKV